MSDRDLEPETFMATVGGYTLRVAHWARADSDQPVLLFFNGVGANIELVGGIGEMFPDRNIVIYDMPGVGLSPVSHFPYSPWLAARWGAKILDQLDYEHVDVIGLSWGGALAQQFTHQYASRVNSLVLCATSTGIAGAPDIPQSMTQIFGLNSLTGQGDVQTTLSQIYGELADPAATDHFDRFIVPHVGGVAYQLMAFSAWNSLSFAPALRTRTLVMSGRNDRIVPDANAVLLHAALPNAELHFIDTGGHMFFVTHQDEVADRISDFHAGLAYA